MNDLIWRKEKELNNDSSTDNFLIGFGLIMILTVIEIICYVVLIKHNIMFPYRGDVLLGVFVVLSLIIIIFCVKSYCSRHRKKKLELEYLYKNDYKFSKEPSERVLQDKLLEYIFYCDQEYCTACEPLDYIMLKKYIDYIMKYHSDKREVVSTIKKYLIVLEKRKTKEIKEKEKHEKNLKFIKENINYD